MKYLVFDAGPIISLSMNGLLSILERLKEEFDGGFIVTPSVKKEIVDKPIKIKKFELEAIKVKHLIEKGVFKLSSDIIDNNSLVSETQKILKKVNGFLRSELTGEKIKILHEGEASCLAFVNLVKEDCVLVVDERTTRLLFEAPDAIKSIMERKLHTELDANLDLIKEIGEFSFIRSSELVYLAYKKGFIEYGRGREVLDALMYALKYHGTTISSKEIEKIKKLA